MTVLERYSAVAHAEIELRVEFETLKERLSSLEVQLHQERAQHLNELRFLDQRFQLYRAEADRAETARTARFNTLLQERVAENEALVKRVQDLTSEIEALNKFSNPGGNYRDGHYPPGF